MTSPEMANDPAGNRVVHEQTSPLAGPNAQGEFTRDDEIQHGLAMARELARLGVPIFVAKRARGTKKEFSLPTGWQTIKADPAVVDGWRDGDALCAVTHGPLAVIDLDPVPGVCTVAELLGKLELPTVYATVETPSGGRHLFVAHLETKTTTGKPIEHVDLRAGYADGTSGGFVYLAPTERVPKYDESGEPRSNALRNSLDDDLVRPYRWSSATLPDAATLAADVSGRALVEALREDTAVSRPSTGGGGERYTHSQARARIEKSRDALYAAPERGCRDEVRDYSWDLARFALAGLAPLEKAESAFYTACTKKWGAPDTADRELWEGTVRKLRAEDFDMRVILDEDLAEGPLVLPSPMTPAPVARKIQALLGENASPLLISDDSWFQYRSNRYASLNDNQVRTLLFLLTEHAVFWTKGKGKDAEPYLAPWNPTPTSVRALRESLSALTDTYAETGVWVGEDRPETGGVLVPLLDGIYDVERNAMLPHDSRWFFTHLLPFTYDPAAQCPTWLKVLEAQWGDCPDTIAALQEWFGYLISGRTDLHKIAALYGPRRTAKGLISRIAQALMGEGGSTGLSVSSLGESFGLQGLLGVPLAVIGDARWKDLKNVSQIVSRLLEISGGDKVDVPRKHKDPWSGHLPTRLMILSNDAPQIPDVTGAASSRLLVFHTSQSFYGREDPTLEPTILAEELAGVFNWALAGLARLAEQGRFTEPEGAAEELEAMEDAGSGVASFIRECCDREPLEAAVLDDLYKAYAVWYREKNDLSMFATVKPGHQTFSSEVRSIVPQPPGRNRTRVNGRLVPVIAGLLLKPETPTSSAAADFAEGLEDDNLL